MKKCDHARGTPEQVAAILKIQRDLAVALTSYNTIEATLNQILIAACKVGGIDCGGIYLVDHETGEYELSCHRNLSAAFVAAVERFTPQGRQARLLMKGHTICLDRAHFQRAIRSVLIGEGLRSTIIVPVKHAGHVVAALNLASRTQDTPPEASRTAIEAFAAQIGPSIARIKAEAALHTNEKNLQTLFNSLEDLLFIVDLDGHLRQVNPMVGHRLGYTPAEIRGCPLTVLHPPDQREQVLAILAAMQAGTTDYCSIPLLAKDGTLLPVETKIVKGVWNGKPCFFGVARDITERMRVEKELLDHRFQLQALVSKMTMAEENERRRIARGLHDDIGQMLAIAKLKLAHVPHMRSQKHIRAAVAEVDDCLSGVIQTTRSLTFELASSVLQRFGLIAAVEDLCAKMEGRQGISFEVHKGAKIKPLRPETEIVMFYAIRELLRNVVSHAKARNASVSFRKTGNVLAIVVEDDGIGFGRKTPTGFSPTGGFGLYTIREQMTHLGGSLAIAPVSPQGSRVTLTIPLVPRDNA